jgi:hypothetical protein
MIRSRTVQWVRHVERKGQLNTSFSKSRGMKPHQTLTGDDNIKTDTEQFITYHKVFHLNSLHFDDHVGMTVKDEL